MHCLEVIVEKNKEAVIRAAAHAQRHGNRAEREAIFNANPDIDNESGWSAVLTTAQEG